MHLLYTIPFSHYCERARWALDIAGLPYQERAYLPILHFGPLALATGGGKAARDPTASRMSVPLLVRDGGAALHDSGAIVRFAAEGGAFSVSAGDAAAIEEEAVLRLGPATRLVCYAYLLPDAANLDATMCNSVSGRQRALYRVAKPLIVAGIRRGLGVSAARGAKATARVDAFFDRSDAALADGRPFLGGDALGSVDLTVAALAAVVLGVDRDAGYGAWLPSVAAMAPALQQQVATWRARPTGEYVLRLYRDHRRAPT